MNLQHVFAHNSCSYSCYRMQAVFPCLALASALWLADREDAFEVKQVRSMPRRGGGDPVTLLDSQCHASWTPIVNLRSDYTEYGSSTRWGELGLLETLCACNDGKAGKEVYRGETLIASSVCCALLRESPFVAMNAVGALRCTLS